MYATVIMMKIEDSSHADEMIKMNLKATEKIKQFKGLVCAYYYSDKEKNEYGNTAIYKTLEDLEASRNARSPEVQAMVNTYGTEYTYQVINAIVPD